MLRPPCAMDTSGQGLHLSRLAAFVRAIPALHGVVKSRTRPFRLLSSPKHHRICFERLRSWPPLRPPWPRWHRPRTRRRANGKVDPSAVAGAHPTHAPSSMRTDLLRPYLLRNSFSAMPRDDAALETAAVTAALRARAQSAQRLFPSGRVTRCSIQGCPAAQVVFRRPLSPRRKLADCETISMCSGLTQERTRHR